MSSNQNVRFVVIDALSGEETEFNEVSAGEDRLNKVSCDSE